MDVQYLTPLRPEFMVNPNKGKRWRFPPPPFEFMVDGVHFVTPPDFWTDFASVPRIIWPIISPYELGVGPIPHDFGYFTGYANKKYWDLVLLACMEKDNIPNWKRQAAYGAVDWFGGKAWNNYREKNTKFLLHGIQRLQVRNWDRHPEAVGERALALLTPQELEWKTSLAGLTARP